MTLACEGWTSSISTVAMSGRRAMSSWARFRNTCARIGAAMQRRSILFPAVVALIVALLAPVSAQAYCQPSATALAFGTYTGLAVTNSTAKVTLLCNASVYSLGLNAGMGLGATVATRKMTSGTNTLNYQLFQDVSYSNNWGNTQNNDARTGTAINGNNVLTIYARLLATQYPAPGTYTDTITATEFDTFGVTTTFTVSVTVQATCSMSASSMPFGTYTGVAANATATLSVTCTSTTPYYINLSDGNQRDGSFYPRMVGPGGALVSYRLYQNSAHTTEWRNTYNLDGQAGTGTGTSQTLTAYGLTAAGQLNVPGAYTDTIIVTLTY